eukprot:scaffold85313_cov67-Phaeocystis_antarctica.AAC.6
MGLISWCCDNCACCSSCTEGCSAPECDDKSSGPVGNSDCVKGPSSGVGGQVLLKIGGQVLRKHGEGGCDCDSGSCNCIDGLSPMSRNMASCCASMTSPCTKRHRAP